MIRPWAEKPMSIPLKPQAHSRRVLIADDIELNRLVLASILESQGYEVETVSDGSAAIRSAADAQFDLILLDVEMPGIDGIAAAAQIRQGHPRSAATKIAAMSVNMAARNRVAGSCIDAFIERPLKMGAFFDLVATLTGGSTAAVVWDRMTFETLERAIGAARIRTYLASVMDRLVEFRGLVADPEGGNTEIAGAAHDLQSVGGMLGFVELSRKCLELQEALRLRSDGVRRNDILDAIDRATEALRGEISNETRKIRTDALFAI